MEELLQSEAKARSLSKSVSSTSPHPMAATTAGHSTVTGSSTVAGGAAREEAKADVMFNQDTGRGMVVGGGQPRKRGGGIEVCDIL